MSGYFESRSQLKYYDAVQKRIELAEGNSILDVGCADTPIAAWGDFETRHAINLGPLPMAGRRPRIEYTFGNFMDFPLSEQFDLVTCLQVLEHLENPGEFAQKLFAHAKRTVIISVPFMWPKGVCQHHLQDPINLPKLQQWTKRDFDEHEIVTDANMARVICTYQL